MRWKETTAPEFSPFLDPPGTLPHPPCCLGRLELGSVPLRTQFSWTWTCEGGRGLGYGTPPERLPRDDRGVLETGGGVWRFPSSGSGVQAGAGLDSAGNLPKLLQTQEDVRQLSACCTYREGSNPTNTLRPAALPEHQTGGDGGA